MSTTRLFTYTTGTTLTPGTEKFGNLTVGYPITGGLGTILQWWNGADEDLGYVIAQTNVNINGIPQQPTQIMGLSGNVGFYRSEIKTDNSFLSLANVVTSQNFNTALSAKTWLETNGYWTSWYNTDSDATAFLTAAGITNPTITSAINALVNDLKFYNLWDKMKAIYPMVGGTASTHKWNLKDPRDLDAAFRLTFYGGWTHSSTGALPNGTNGYADTYYNPRNSGQLNSAHLSYYSRTDLGTSGLQVDIGGYDGNSQWLLYTYGNSSPQGINGSFVNIPYGAIIPTNGFLLGQRLDNTTINYFHKGVKIQTLSNNSTNTPNLSIYLAARNDGGPVLVSSKECAFASLGDGNLTDSEAINFTTIVQKFQTTLNREIY